MEILDAEGMDAERFVWVHANLETDTALHREVARRGAYVEFDAVGAPWQSQPALVIDTLALIEAGYAEKILLSHDAGYYDPSQPDGRPAGEGIRGYTALAEEFIPALRASAVADDTVRTISVANPGRAFGRSQPRP